MGLTAARAIKMGLKDQVIITQEQISKTVGAITANIK